mmetsp:Transcript_12481/g.34657  ORF Transcript_12481/g.34657 Transcript_12481/m.34657 type:complete len:81 (-) Transcript_12481:199-441(-)
MSSIMKLPSSLYQKAFNYYQPMFRAGSVTPLWHMMLFVSVTMYSTGYMAKDYQNIQHKHHVQKEALKEYYEKHGGGDDHH